LSRFFHFLCKIPDIYGFSLSLFERDTPPLINRNLNGPFDRLEGWGLSNRFTSLDFGGNISKCFACGRLAQVELKDAPLEVVDWSTPRTPSKGGFGVHLEKTTHT
jgi:hypothetical protein